MKQDILAIAPSLKVGQIIKASTKTFAFIRIENGKILVKDILSKKTYVINKGAVEVTDDFDDATTDYSKKRIELECKVRQMRSGQLFIGNDDKEYYFVKFNRTRFVMKDRNRFEYTAKPEFVKRIIDDVIIPMECNPNLCKYCEKSVEERTGTNALCSGCLENLGRRCYREL